MAERSLLDFSTRLLAFYATYVASQARGQAPSLLQGLVEGAPAWERMPRADGEAGPLETFCREAAELGAVSPGRALADVTSRLAVARVIEAFGTEPQKARWASSLSSGQARGAYALSEPQAGSDATLCEAVAERRDGAWVITGSKTQVTAALRADAAGAEAEGVAPDLVIVFARGAGESEDERSRLTAFLVPGGASELRWTLRRARGLEEAGLADLAIAGVEVEREAILGAPGAGTRVAQFLIDLVRLGTAAILAGALRKAEAAARARLAERSAFGHRLIELDMVAERLVFLAERHHAIEALVSLTARLAEAGCEIGAEAAALKVFASDAARESAAALAELAGGGAADPAIADLVAAVNALGAAGGSNDVARFYLAVHGTRRVSGWLSANAKAKRGASWFDATVKRWWRGVRLAATRPRVPRLLRAFPGGAAEEREAAEALALWRECAGVTAERVHQVHDHFGDEVLETQYHLQRLATMMIETWALTAVLWHVPAARDRAMSTLSPRLRARRAWRAVAYASSELFVGDAWDVEDYAKGFRPGG